MTDDPEGGGGPVGTVILDGASNAVFQDVTEFDRAGGAVSARQLFLTVQTPTVETFQDANIIVSRVPNDANVSITLAKCGVFDRRTDIANAIENYLIQGPEWGGYLLENHVVGQRSIQLLQRPGTPVPPIGRTLVLIYNEGLGTERKQYVRVTRVETETRTFSYAINGGYVDYPADVVTCDLSDALRLAFPGSPPNRSYARDVTKTVLRDTTVADAATYYGAVSLTAVAALGDSTVKVSSVYSQLVPSARTETVALDQRPAAVRAITLADTPRRVDVAVAAHTQRIKIGQENRGFSFVALLKPLPSPRTVVISYMALGNWYTISDDGAGAFEGAGVGQIIYNTGSVSMTFPSMPDVGSAVIIQWGEAVGYTNRSSQGAAIRAPEYCWLLEDEGVVAGSVVITWYSGGLLRTATDDSNGKFTGDGTGSIDYPSNTVLLRPTYMPDPGAQFNVNYTVDEVKVELLAAPAPDAGGFVTLALAQQPAAGTLEVSWAVARTVSNSSGGTDSATSAAKTAAATFVIKSVPEFYVPAAPSGATEGKPILPNVTSPSTTVNWPRHG